MLDSVRSGRCSLPPLSRRGRERPPAPPAVGTGRYWRAPSVSATARYSEDYSSGGRQAGERLEDSRIAPSHYSYLSLRARTPSTDRQQAASKQLRFPKTNLGTNNSLTLLIKPRGKVGEACEAPEDDFLPVEVVAVGDKVSRSPPKENYGGHTYTRRMNQVGRGIKVYLGGPNQP